MNKKVFSTLLVPVVCALLLCAALAGTGGFFQEDIRGGVALCAAGTAEESNSLRLEETASLPAMSGEETVLLGGYPIGIDIRPQGVIITSKVGVVTKKGVVTPFSGIELDQGDLLCAINGEQVRSADDIARLLEKSDGEVTVTIEHAGKRENYLVTPAEDSVNGLKKLGLMLQESVSGVGTLTFVDRRGRYGALGHPVKDAHGNTIEPEGGNIYPAAIKGVVPGKRGKAGELKGVYSKESGSIGEIDSDNIFGIFGKYCGNGEKLTEIAVAPRESVQPGKAYIYSTVFGTSPRLYEIEIIKAERQNSPLDKSMVVRVTDRKLLAETGGIVQGMSGSPVIQNGKLVGAITHVLIDDPTKGYAVYAEWMMGR